MLDYRSVDSSCENGGEAPWKKEKCLENPPFDDVFPIFQPAMFVYRRVIWNDKIGEDPRILDIDGLAAFFKTTEDPTRRSCGLWWGFTGYI